MDIPAGTGEIGLLQFPQEIKGLNVELFVRE